MDFNEALFKKQGERITKLTEDINKLQRINDELRLNNNRLQEAELAIRVADLEGELCRLTRPAKFYLKMVELIEESVMLQAEWVRFVALMKLNYDDLPGYTSEENEMTGRVA